MHTSSFAVPNFRQIRSFLALARLLSFTRAAEELGISQPTLTVQIHQLEEMLSVILFDRNRRQVRLTDIGRNLLQPFEQLLADLEAVRNFTSDHSQLRNGTIRLAALPSLASSLLPKAIHAFTETHPGVTVHVQDVDVDQIIQMLKLEQLDFGIGMKLLPDKDITTDAFLADQLCVFFPEGHPLQAKKNRKIELEDCLAYPLILTSRGGSTRMLVERALVGETQEVTVAQEVNHMSTALGLVQNGMGISILPASAVANGSMSGLDFAPIASPHLHRKIGIMRKTSRQLSPAASRFLEVLANVARENPIFKTDA